MNNKKYRKIYGIKNIPPKWTIHHIDFNHYNNEINNLIPIPQILHKIIHNLKCYLCYSSDVGYALRATWKHKVNEKDFLQSRKNITTLINIYTKLTKKEIDINIVIQEIVDNILTSILPKQITI